jgi:hypothetical protein
MRDDPTPLDAALAPLPPDCPACGGRARLKGWTGTTYIYVCSLCDLLWEVYDPEPARRPGKGGR